MKKINKITIFTEGPYSGILRSIIEDSKHFNKMGFEITYLLPDSARNRYGETREKNFQELVKYGKIECTPLRRTYMYLFLDLLKVKRYFSNASYDVVISYGGYAGKLGRLLYTFGFIKRLIHIPQGFDTIHKTWDVKYPDEFFERVLAQKCTRYLACGSSEVFKLQNRYRVPAEKIYLMPNGVGIKRIAPSKTSNSRYTYVILSRIARDKRVDKSLFALQSMNLLSKTLVIGDGIELPGLRDEFPQATFLGNIANDQIFQYLADARFILSSSVIEGMPFSVLEAMSQGCIPILSCIDGHKDIIQNGLNGFIFDSSASLLDTLLYTEVMSEEDYERISLSAINTVKNLQKTKEVRMKSFFEKDFVL